MPCAPPVLPPDTGVPPSSTASSAALPPALICPSPQISPVLHWGMLPLEKLRGPQKGVLHPIHPSSAQERGHSHYPARDSPSSSSGAPPQRGQRVLMLSWKIPAPAKGCVCADPKLAIFRCSLGPSQAPSWLPLSPALQILPPFSHLGHSRDPRQWGWMLVGHRVCWGGV